MGILGKDTNYQNALALLGFILLAGVSLINLRNADMYSAAQFHYAQIIWYLFGGVLAVLVSRLDIILFERLAWVIYGLAILLLIAVVVAGTEVNNSKRWLELFGFRGQPSELTKIATVLVIARFFHRSRQVERYTLKTLWQPFLMAVVPALLIITQPDLGTTLSLVFVAVSMIFYAGVRLRSVLVLLAIAGVGIPLAWQTNIILPYQKDRVALWLNPEQFKWDENTKRRIDKSMQPEQALWAVGAGQLTGKGGGGGSRTRLRSLPEMQTDFVIAAYAEERGFVGCFGLIALFYLLVVWGMGVARDARDRFSALVAVGVSALIFWQMFMNIGMAIGLLPVVGITLPFLSYGGTALITSLVGVGLLFNVAMNQRRR